MSRNAQNDHLTRLEQTSIHVFREAFANFRSVCMPWSMGKDSNVLIWLARKAFCGKIPFPLLHIDTTYEFPEMYEFREKAKVIHGIDLIVRVNEDAIRRGIGYATHDPVTVTHELKTVPFKAAIDEFKWDALVTGIRRDEDPTRAKERWFSPRSAEGNWDYKDQPPEFWGQFASSAPDGGHVRVQPLLEWTELDIWEYIRRENIPNPTLYFARDGKRFRSLGCHPITHPVDSPASNIDEVIEELKLTKTSERAGRAQDHVGRNSMQELRAKGFM
ncbi:MAG: Sulfate adenylyltransferase subunit 2 [Verrucomicrobiota bacterium]|jgi:sulfate adenylyltransferase subunit 2